MSFSTFYSWIYFITGLGVRAFNFWAILTVLKDPKLWKNWFLLAWMLVGSTLFNWCPNSLEEFFIFWYLAVYWGKFGTLTGFLLNWEMSNFISLLSNPSTAFGVWTIVLLCYGPWVPIISYPPDEASSGFFLKTKLFLTSFDWFSELSL